MNIAEELVANFDKFESAGIKKTAKVHKLKSGENIGILSRLYNVTEEQIFEANKDRNIEQRKGVLQIGEPIFIPLSALEFSKRISSMDLPQQIDSAAKFAGVPADLFRAMIKVESQNCTQNLSSAGAKGCGQLMPNILSLFGVKNPDNTSQNLSASAQYLASLIRSAPGADTHEKEWNSVMMYNWGPGNFSSWYSTKDPEKLNAEAKSHPKKIFDILGRSVPMVYKGIYDASGERTPPTTTGIVLEQDSEEG